MTTVFEAILDLAKKLVLIKFKAYSKKWLSKGDDTIVKKFDGSFLWGMLRGDLGR